MTALHSRALRMWCPHCLADVAPALANDQRRLLCIQCQQELGSAAEAMRRASEADARAAETERDTRELLARWSTENLLADTGRSPAPTPSVGSASLMPAPTATPLMLETPMTAPETPRETPHEPAHDPAAPATTGSPSASHDESSAAPRLRAPHFLRKPARTEEPARRRTKQVRLDASHPIDDADAESPRERRPAAPRSRGKVSRAARAAADQARLALAHSGKPANVSWMGFLGQICAYAGVGLLTCGTALVLSSYFGGPAHFAATGWMLTTVGQMMLFLGVVTLISGGLEQTTAEVARRIDRLGERLIRIEVAHGAHELRGPHFAPRGRRRRRGEAAQVEAGGRSSRSLRGRDDAE